MVLGPNGAGKTTLLNLAAGRLHPTTGAVHVLGERIGRIDVNELRTRIGLSTAALAERIPADERVTRRRGHRRLVGGRPLAGELRPRSTRPARRALLEPARRRRPRRPRATAPSPRASASGCRSPAR